MHSLNLQPLSPFVFLTQNNHRRNDERWHCPNRRHHIPLLCCRYVRFYDAHTATAGFFFASLAHQRDGCGGTW